MKDHVEKSMRIVTLIAEALAAINNIHRKRNKKI
jgi:hypothetical protein